MLPSDLNTELEKAFLQGNSSFILSLPYETSDDPLLEIVVQKIADTLKLCLDSLDKNEAIVKNVLKILTDFKLILKNDLGQCIVIAECMLRIATEVVVPVNIIKCAIFNLNSLLRENESLLNWLQNEGSLEGFLLILGRRLPTVGDFECQSYIFETLCQTIYDNENKPKWIQSWFTDDEKTRSMFLNWNLEQWTVESRKILNQINRRELNPRTFAFAATAVYFGNMQLKKLNGLEFWIDFNYDSRSISFFCSDFDDEDSESWDTVTILPEDVKSYSVQKKNDSKSIELCIILNSTCQELTMSSNPSFETNLVRMIFWIYVDISSHLKMIFGEPEMMANGHNLNSQISQGSQRTQKVSTSVDALDIAATRKVRKISASDVVKIHEENYCNLKERRISDSTLVPLFDDDDSDEIGANILPENNFVERGQINAQNIESLKQDASETELHPFDKNAAESEPRKKRLKKSSEVVDRRKSPTDRLSKRKPNDVEIEVISSETPPKKQRKATEKNKNILEGNEPEDATEGKSKNINLGNGEIEEVFCTPPTKPVKKRRLKSVFSTDTETGSSNVSWFGGKTSCLFETPQKYYSNRNKSKQLSKSASKKGIHKSIEMNSKRKRKSNISKDNFKIKSKSGLSDLENYELVVESKKDRNKFSHSNRKIFTFKEVSKALKAAEQSAADKSNFDDQPDNESNNVNFESRMNDNIPEFTFDEEHYKNESMVKKDFITPQRHVKNINKEDLLSNVSDESNAVAKQPYSKDKLSNINKSLFQEKESSNNSELYQKTASNDLKLSNSAKKRKLATLSASKKVKRSRKDSNSNQLINLDSVAPISNDLHVQDLIVDDEFSPNEPSVFTTQNLVSSKTLEKDKSSSMCVSEKTAESLYPSTESPKIGVLTEQSLSSLEHDEAIGKEKHIQKFLEGLTDESNSPNNFQHAENFDQDFAPLNYKTSKSNKSSRSDNLLRHSISEDCFSEEDKISDLPFANYTNMKKRKQLTSFEDYNHKSKASFERSHQKFSLVDDCRNSGHQEECLDRSMIEENYQETSKIVKRKSKQSTVFRLLGIEMDLMTQKLLKALQKHFRDYNIKINATREKILATTTALASKENNWEHKDLKNIAKAYKLNRIRAEKSLKRILAVGQQYFEAEDLLSHKMKRLHKKVLRKYEARVKLAGSYAVNALEDRAAAKTEVLLKSTLKKIEQI